MFKRMIDKFATYKFTRFLVVGIINTIIGTSIMFFAYNVLDYGYWVSSALNYILGSIFSYIANKYFTFASKERSVKEIIRFVINILVCYLLAYGIAEPIVKFMCNMVSPNMETKVMEQLAMLFGMCMFVCFNFLGQKFLVFKTKS